MLALSGGGKGHGGGMSFGSLFDGGAGGGSGGMQFPFSAGFSSSPGLSLGLVRARLPACPFGFDQRASFATRRCCE